MENKYYVPNITEFRVGFGYEEKSSGLWAKQIYNESSPILNAQIWDEYGCKLDTIKDYIEQEQVRVKYLDTSDIESFGFKFYAEGRISVSYLYEDYFITFYDNRHLLINKSNGMCQVDNKLFSGKINNKSELQQVLKMIGVIQ